MKLIEIKIEKKGRESENLEWGVNVSGKNFIFKQRKC